MGNSFTNRPYFIGTTLIKKQQWNKEEIYSCQKCSGRAKRICLICYRTWCNSCWKNMRNAIFSKYCRDCKVLAKTYYV